MHIRILTAILLLWTLSSAGCMLPRNLAMHSWLDNEIPVPAGGQRLTQYDNIFANNIVKEHPSARTVIQSSLPPAEAFEWLQQALTERGWFPENDPDSSDHTKVPHWDPPKPLSDKDSIVQSEYYAVRERCGSPKGWPMVREHLSIQLTYKPTLIEGTHFNIIVTTDYIWDQPTQWIEYVAFFPIEKLWGPDGAMVVRLVLFVPVLQWF